jgi:hypothetical protein
VFDSTPAKTSTNVSSRFGAEMTMSRNAVPIRPLPSAMPMPSIATSTVPSGAKPVKFVTMLVRIRCSPAMDIRFTGRISSPVPGCVTTRSNWAVMPDTTTTSSAMRANSVPGCGSALPTRSMTVRDRLSHPEGGSMAGLGSSVTEFSCTWLDSGFASGSDAKI